MVTVGPCVGVAVGVLVSVAVAVGVGVVVSVAVAVLVGVSVAVGGVVAVAVPVGMAVPIGAGVAVAGGTGVAVTIPVADGTGEADDTRGRLDASTWAFSQVAGRVATPTAPAAASTLRASRRERLSKFGLHRRWKMFRQWADSTTADRWLGGLPSVTSVVS
jgi:hypothetical protein